MITIQTEKPVYSNAGGKKTKEEKQASRKKFLEQSQNIYSKGKETGILGGLENLFLGAGKGQGQGGGMTTGGGTNTGGGGDGGGDGGGGGEKKAMNPALKWGLIIGGVAVVGVAVWYFGFRNKSKNA